MSEPSVDIRTLVERCRGGDSTAWRSLVQQYAALVHSVPIRYGLPRAEVEDVAQEVFLALAQGLAQVEDVARLPAWLLTTARRCTWRAIQKRALEEPSAVADVADIELLAARPIATPPPTISELLAGWQRQEMIAQGFSHLGERCRKLLQMIFLDPDEPSYEMIAEQLSMPKGSIGPTRNRCLQQLRIKLEGLGYENKE